MYLSVRLVEEVACMILEIPARHVGRRLQRTDKQKRRKMHSERKEDEKEERRTNTG